MYVDVRKIIYGYARESKGDVVLKHPLLLSLFFPTLRTYIVDSCKDRHNRLIHDNNCIICVPPVIMLSMPTCAGGGRSMVPSES